jgi:hypothetical protein
MTMSVEIPRSRRERLRAWFWIGLANAVPRTLAYACTLRVAAHAACGKWSEENPHDLTVFMALHRWDKSSSRIGTTDDR